MFGLEQDDGIAALAIVNMIFRGDGKNNIEQASCLSKYLAPDEGPDSLTAKFINQPSNNPPVTRVLMNPPFALENEKEYIFVTHALKQMEEHRLLFSILPYAVMVKPGAFKTWRQNLLRENALLAVVTFPIDIFYPVSAPVGIFVRKGTPHRKKQNTLWIRAEADGHLKSKGKRLPSGHTTNKLEDCIPTLKAFLNDPSMQVVSQPRYMIATPIDFNDSHLELVPEAYLEKESLSDNDIMEGVDDVLRDCAAFLIRNRIKST